MNRNPTVLLCVGLLLGAAGVAVTLASAATAASGPDHTVIVVMENRDRTEVIGNSAAPYENALVAKGIDYANAQGQTHPSLGNYLTLYSGSTQGQDLFNPQKGSIPARMDVDLSKGFNPCQQLAQKDLQASIAAGTLVRSMAHNMTVLQKYRGAMMEAITEFVNTPDQSAADAAKAMADAVEAQM